MAPVRAIFEVSYIVVFLAATVGVKGEARGVELVTMTLLDVTKSYSHLTINM